MRASHIILIALAVLLVWAVAQYFAGPPTCAEISDSTTCQEFSK